MYCEASWIPSSCAYGSSCRCGGWLGGLLWSASGQGRRPTMSPDARSSPRPPRRWGGEIEQTWGAIVNVALGTAAPAYQDHVLYVSVLASGRLLARAHSTRRQAPAPDSTSSLAQRESGAALDRRILGLENEYGVTCTFRGQRRLSPDEVARYLFRRVVSWGRSS